VDPLPLLRHFSARHQSIYDNGQVLSAPPHRVWGLPGCPTTSCPSKAFDFQSEVPRKSTLFHEKARCSCNLCGFRRTWISRPSWKAVGALYPRRFWFDFLVHRSHLAALNVSLLENQADCREAHTRDGLMDVDG
jgi:hypothetical protein